MNEKGFIKTSFFYLTGKRLLGWGVVFVALFLCLDLTPVQADQSANTILARVNDTPIDEVMLKAVIQEYKTKNNREITPDEKEQILNNLITRQLILQEDSVQALKKDPQIVSQVKKYEQDLIVTSFLKKNITARLQITDAEIMDYYKKNRHEFTSPPKVAAKHILLRSREDAERVMKKLQAGQNFEELAKEHSIDLPMALEGGSMGTIEKGKTLPELDKELFGLKEGEVSGIVKTRFGYHILKVDKSIPSQAKPFEEVKNSIKQQLLRQKELALYKEVTEELRKNAHIVIYDEKFSGITQGKGAKEKP